MAARKSARKRPSRARPLEPHEVVVAAIRKMTPKQIIEAATRAGIYTPSGKLAKWYRPEPVPSK